MRQRFTSVEHVIDVLAPSYPVYCLRPSLLEDTVRQFTALFPGTVLYAVKCNPHPRVLDALQTDELCPCNWKKGEATIKV